MTREEEARQSCGREAQPSRQTVVDPETGMAYTRHTDGTYSREYNGETDRVHPDGPLGVRLRAASRVAQWES